MHKITLLVLGLLCLLPAALNAEEGQAGDVTTQVPKNSQFFIRIKSLDRMDAVAKEAVGILEILGAKREAAALKEMPLSTIFAAETGFDLTTVDRTKPVYAVMTNPRQDAFMIATPAAGAAWDGEKALKRDQVAMLRGGALLIGERAQFGLEPRGVPTRSLDGDIVFHVYLGEIVEANKEMIDAGFARAAMQGAGIPGIPDTVRALVLPMVSAVKEGVFSVESFDYAITLKEDIAVSEGLLVTKPRSNMRTLLQRAGAPGTNPMVAYLPVDAFITYDSVSNIDWPGKELAAFLDKALGEGAGEGVNALMGAANAFTEHMTGRTAGAVTLLGMSASTVSIAELKEGTDAAKMFENFNLESVNAALKKMGIPLAMKLEKAFGKHGETELHRLTMQSENFQIGAIVSMMQTFICAENGHLFTCASPTAERDLQELLDRVRAGQKVEHPHAQAMARLGKTHNLGITVNIAALKPLGFLLGMAVPEAATAMAHIPDTMRMSTAVTFADGNIHWRGDWPVKDMMFVAEKMMPKPKAEKPKAEEEDDFK